MYTHIFENLSFIDFLLKPVGCSYSCSFPPLNNTPNPLHQWGVRVGREKGNVGF